MANFLTRLTERTLGTVPVAQPIIAPMFAPQSITSPSPLYGTSLAIESEIEAPVPRHVPQETPQPQGLRNDTMSQTSHPSEQSTIPAPHTSSFQQSYAAKQPEGPDTNVSQEQQLIEQAAIHASVQPTIASAESQHTPKPLVSTAINSPVQLENVTPSSNMGGHAELQSSPLVQDSPAQSQHLAPTLDVFHEQASNLPAQVSALQQTTTPNEKSEIQQSETQSGRETHFSGETHASPMAQPSTQETLVRKEHTMDTTPSARPLIRQQATIHGMLIAHEHTESALHENASSVPPRTSEETQLLVPSFATAPSIVPASPSPLSRGLETPLDSPSVRYTALSLEQPALLMHAEQETQQQERTLLSQPHQPLPNDLSGSPDRKRSQNAASTPTHQTGRNVQNPGTVASGSIPTIHVSIGSIDVRAIMPSSPSAPRPQPGKPGPTLSLQDYARQRKGGER